MYVMELSHRSGRDLISVATIRTNVIPIVDRSRTSRPSVKEMDN